jgi:ATP-dependent Clp protease, protease subunit
MSAEVRARMMDLPPEVQSALFHKGVVFLRGRLDDAAANAAVTQLLLMSRAAPGQSIDVYLDSPGGTLSAALAVHDIVRTVDVAVSITCLGTAGGASVLVLAGGAAGRRYALPHARIHLIDEQVELSSTRAADMASSAIEIGQQRLRWQTALAAYTAHSVEHVGRDLAAGRWLSAAEARDYGLVDGIIPGVPRFTP